MTATLIGPDLLVIKDKDEAYALARAICDMPRNGKAWAFYSGYCDGYIIEWMPKRTTMGNMTVRTDGSVWNNMTGKLIKRCVLPTLDAPYYRGGAA